MNKPNTMTEFNLFIDDTCHLENDKTQVMGIGYIKINRAQQQMLSMKIKQIRRQFRTPMELKWSNLSASRLPLYKALVNYLFACKMTFRAVLIKNK